MRRSIADHMVRSRRTAPHVTTVFKLDLRRVVAHRARAQADFARQGVKLTYTAYFVQAACAALLAVPSVNASYADEGIVQHRAVNIGVAVALDEGLIVPVIRAADEKNLLGLARAVNDLAERARARRLSPTRPRTARLRSQTMAWVAACSQCRSSISHRPRSWAWVRSRSAWWW